MYQKRPFTSGLSADSCWRKLNQIFASYAFMLALITLNFFGELSDFLQKKTLCRFHTFNQQIFFQTKITETGILNFAAHQNDLLS